MIFDLIFVFRNTQQMEQNENVIGSLTLIFSALVEDIIRNANQGSAVLVGRGEKAARLARKLIQIEKAFFNQLTFQVTIFQ